MKPKRGSGWMWGDEQLKEAGVEKEVVHRIIRCLRTIVRELDGSDLAIYVASDSANIHQKSRHPHADQYNADPECVIAYVNGPFDGGDW